ncbi:MAG TPA: PAS domain S-box protein [Steroidobacteraceae bacterium]|nr:PAS domain S-box protein [Steroidobacteraceae bacterium]
MTLLRVAEPQEERADRLEREFQAVLDAAVDAVVLFDHEGRIELLNHAGERMFGYNEQEVIGLKVHILLPEPFRSQQEDYLRNYIEPGEPRIIGIGRELLAKRRDGSEFSAELAVGRVQGTEPPRFVGFIRDITVRRNAEEALRRSEAQLTIAQEIANLGNYVVDFDGQTEDYWSPHLYRVLGRRYGESYIGVYDFLQPRVHPADRARWQQAKDELDAVGRAMDIEYRITHPDGSLRYVHHIAQATRSPSGKMLRQVGTLHDITDRRLAEDEARQMQDRIAHFGRISTMGEMAAGIAHEVNQPLTAIATYAQACQRLIASGNATEEEIASALEHIGAQALRAGEVIRRLRTFVKNREVRRELVDANRLLADVLTLAETDARHHGVHMVLEPATQSPQVQADVVQIQQVILNLVRNSIDAMTEIPEARREIVLKTELDNEGDVQFTVADRGIGVSAEMMAELFNPFFTTKPGGTGLGLSISRSIVRAHGGKLWCGPNPGGGARFFFTLPSVPAAGG